MPEECYQIVISLIYESDHSRSCTEKENRKNLDNKTAGNLASSGVCFCYICLRRMHQESSLEFLSFHKYQSRFRCYRSSPVLKSRTKSWMKCSGSIWDWLQIPHNLQDFLRSNMGAPDPLTAQSQYLRFSRRRPILFIQTAAHVKPWQSFCRTAIL